MQLPPRRRLLLRLVSWRLRVLPQTSSGRTCRCVCVCGLAEATSQLASNGAAAAAAVFAHQLAILSMLPQTSSGRSRLLLLMVNTLCVQRHLPSAAAWECFVAGC